MSAARELFEKARQARAAGRHLDARLAVAAGLSELARGAQVIPVVVGGTAVDFHAASQAPSGLEPSGELQASLDVDIITIGRYGPDAEALRRRLAESPDFYPETSAIPLAAPRKWWLHGAPLLVEVLGKELYGSKERIVRVEVEQGTAYLWSPEDTAWQYMQAALSQRDRTSWERARAIASAQREIFDWDYLRTRPEPLAPPELVDALWERDSYDQMVERCAA